VLVPAAAAVLMLGATYAYTGSQRDVIAAGIRVGRIDLGGLSANAAQTRLAQTYRPLGRALVLRYGGGRFVLRHREARVSVDTRVLVARALRLSQRGWFLPLAWRELTGAPVKAILRPRIT
jgi:hypothetical protein